MLTNFDIAMLIGALRHVCKRQVGQARQQVFECLRLEALGILRFGNRAFQALDLGHQFRGAGVVLLRLGLADLAGQLFQLRLIGLEGRLGGAQIGIQLQQRIDIALRRFPVAGSPALDKSLRIFA